MRKFYVSRSLKNGSEVVIVYSVLPGRKVLNLAIGINFISMEKNKCCLQSVPEKIAAILRTEEPGGL